MVTQILPWLLEKASFRDLKALVSGRIGGGTKSSGLVSTVGVWALPGVGTDICPALCSRPCMVRHRICSETTGDWLPGTGLSVLASPDSSALCWRQSCSLASWVTQMHCGSIWTQVVLKLGLEPQGTLDAREIATLFSSTPGNRARNSQLTKKIGPDDSMK